MIKNPEKESVETVLSLMALSARTAPKGKGLDSLVMTGVTGEDLGLLAGEMTRLGDTLKLGIFKRDAKNVAASDGCLILGIAGQEGIGINCGGCGFQTCTDMHDHISSAPRTASPFSGPNCVIKMADLGIAVGSAVKTASLHNLDNRVMYTAGVAALALGMVRPCSVAYGIPLKASGKNIFFDRS
jgi:uncharacterized ferredoxin-like protein